MVAVAKEAFDKVLGDRPNQVERRRDDVAVTPPELLAAAATPGEVTEAGLRGNVSVAFRYISFWLSGRGAAGINNFMEDAATAEISRSQVWQWIRHGVTLPDGTPITRELVTRVLDEETARIHAEVGDDVWKAGRPEETREVFERVALSADLPEFLTLEAYDRL